ncbi:MAG TPA: ABC transporter substrate-binding protein [Arachnia sp.]|nr:ABC transporter substrate-binding protein [Arachnia sp.]HMT87057.1 ABC transporter substrate-binding protein [Arachnia sp.]
MVFPTRAARIIAVVGAGMLALTACADEDPGSANTAAGAGAQELTTVNVGVVPTLSLGVLAVGEEQGFFADEGIKLNVVPVDSGPNVIAGLVAGQYHAGYTAYVPPLLAVGSGQDLRLVVGLGGTGTAGDNGGVLVRADSGIDSWADLPGAKLGTNAPRSAIVLWTQGAIDAEGGDSTDLELIPLPFNQIAEKVASGEIDAGVTLQPYEAQAQVAFPELKNLGDPAAVWLPEGTPSGGLFTSAQTATEQADLIDALRRATLASVEYGNQHLDEVRTAGAALAGLSAEDAELIALQPFDTSVDAASFEPLLRGLRDFGWVESEIDLDAFLGEQG